MDENKDKQNQDQVEGADSSPVDVASENKEMLSPLVLELQQEGKKVDYKKLFNDVKFYLMPILIVVFFILIVVFFIVRPISDLSSKLNEISELEDTYKEREDTIADLVALTQSQSTDQELINRIETLVPTNSTRVVEFRDRLEEIATNSGLSVDSITAGESLQSDEDNPFINLSDSALYLIEIPTELTATGTLDNLQNFLTNLYLSTDFFVVNQMSINQSALDGNWKAEFIIVKYQFGGTVNLPSDYSKFVVGKPVQEVVDFLQSKFQQGN